jgi:hypothetical protein
MLWNWTIREETSRWNLLSANIAIMAASFSSAAVTVFLLCVWQEEVYKGGFGVRGLDPI